jgi:hypothetical protein
MAWLQFVFSAVVKLLVCYKAAILRIRVARRSSRRDKLIRLLGLRELRIQDQFEVMHTPSVQALDHKCRRVALPRESTIASIRPIYANMSDQFFYLRLKFSPKIGHTVTNQREVVVKVPKHLVQRKQSELMSENLKEMIALDLARRAALGTFPTVAERVIGLYDEGPPIWYEERPKVMDERPCDNEENGTKAWRVV